MTEIEDHSFDVAIIGAGIAGASVAAELAPRLRVLLVEMEEQPGYHTTGRSAALFSETYGPAPVRALTRASRAFYEAPGEGFGDQPLLSSRGVLFLAREDQLGALEAINVELGELPGKKLLDADETRALLPLLRDGYAAASIHDRSASDIDVNALHQGYLRRFRAAGGTIVTDRMVTGLDRVGGRWQIETNRGEFSATAVVNAAGAWADKVGEIAGTEPIGLVPKRRTALIVAAPEGTDPDPWPMAVGVEEDYYLKPDAGRLLISPADETPSEPCDAQPDELDVAICVDRIQTAFNIEIRRIENRWAGLRSFVLDKVPVCGFDPGRPGFFWFAGQGGYGIQMAPALAAAAACLILERPIATSILEEGLRPEQLAPERLRPAERMAGRA